MYIKGSNMNNSCLILKLQSELSEKDVFEGEEGEFLTLQDRI